MQASLERCFSQTDFNAFASLSGDNNPIHVDPAFSARSRFGRTVAHGLLLCSVLRGLVEELLPGARLADQSVMFPAPTFAGDKMLFSARIVATHRRGSDIEMAVVRQKDGVTTCQGHCRVMP